MSHEHAVFHSFMQNNTAAATTIIKIGVLQSTHYLQVLHKNTLFRILIFALKGGLYYSFLGASYSCFAGIKFAGNICIKFAQLPQLVFFSESYHLECDISKVFTFNWSNSIPFSWLRVESSFSTFGKPKKATLSKTLAVVVVPNSSLHVTRKALTAAYNHERQWHP